VSGEPALRCSGLGKRYGRRGWALRDCDLELPHGGSSGRMARGRRPCCTSRSAWNYLAAHGMRHFTEYHPAGSFWTFQAIEAALFAGVAAALLTGAVWLVRRRIT
jgi:hypothetical protein